MIAKYAVEGFNTRDNTTKKETTTDMPKKDPANNLSKALNLLFELIQPKSKCPELTKPKINNTTAKNIEKIIILCFASQH
jgi:hypothetical protein